MRDRVIHDQHRRLNLSPDYPFQDTTHIGVPFQPEGLFEGKTDPPRRHGPEFVQVACGLCPDAGILADECIEELSQTRMGSRRRSSAAAVVAVRSPVMGHPALLHRPHRR